MPSQLSVQIDWIWFPWMDALPLNWKQQCEQGTSKVPGSFLISIVEWICTTEQDNGQVRVLSDLELVFLFLHDREFCFPFSVDGSSSLEMRPPESLFLRPTVAMLLRSVQFAVTWLRNQFPSVFFRTVPQPRPSLGVYMKFAGVRLRIPNQLWDHVQQQLTNLTATRAIRRCSDLARPLP